MDNDQKNVVEIGNTQSNEAASPKKEKTDWEQTLEAMMRRAYINGLAHGMKTMCGSILERMNQYGGQRMNPQMQLIELRKWCNHCLSNASAPIKENQAKNSDSNAAPNDQASV